MKGRQDNTALSSLAWGLYLQLKLNKAHKGPSSQRYMKPLGGCHQKHLPLSMECTLPCHTVQNSYILQEQLCGEMHSANRHVTLVG